MQKISKFFGSAARPSQPAQTAKPSSSQPQSSAHSSTSIDLTDDDFTATSSPVPPALPSVTSLDFPPNEQRSQKFTSVLSTAFGDRDNQSKTTTTTNGSSASASAKLTPLEAQIVSLKKAHPDSLLMVEVGYRIRFFGDDALAAASVLGVVAHKDKSFMVASVPTYRLLVHCRRLLAAGHKVGLVRQTETAALRKGTKGASSSTFTRDVVAVFSPGGVIDSDDPVFADLLRSSKNTSSSSSKGKDDDDEGEGGDDEDDDDVGAGEDDFDDEHGETWLVAVCTNALHSISIASVNIQSNTLRHCHLSDPSEAALTTQALCDYLDALQPAEVIVSDDCSSATWDLLQGRAVGVIKLSTGATLVGGKGGAVSAAAPGALPQYIKRLTLVSASRFIPLTSSSLPLSPSSSSSSSSSSDGRGDWLEALGPEERRAAGGLGWYLRDLGMGKALAGPTTENDNLESNKPTNGASSSSSVAPSRRHLTFKLDSITARDLEIFSAEARTSHNSPAGTSMQFNKSKPGLGSLVWVINHCQSSYGQRTLKSWLAQPFCEREGILARQECVAWLHSAGQERKDSRDGSWLGSVKSLISSSSDLESGLAALHHHRCSPKRILELLKWAARLESMQYSAPASTAADGANMPSLLHDWIKSTSLQRLARRASELFSELQPKACQDDVLTEVFGASTTAYPEMTAKRRDVKAAEESLKAHLLEIRKILRLPALEYKTLNTGATSSLEYLVEVPVGQKSAVPSSWGAPVNSTKAQLRYHPPEVLKDLDKLQRGRDELKIACKAAWATFVQKTDQDLHDEVRQVLAILGRIDALLSLVLLSQQSGYVKPIYSTESQLIDIRGGRHPMAEKLLELKAQSYISNDARIGCEFTDGRCLVCSGPNMGGKSSYVRMVAIICLLGQIGAHVPADYASLPIMDQIFTRMGAGDDLASGQSTFMTELYRTSRILQHSTPKSLVILDELGRGTATFDGTAIALATLQHIVEEKGCALLFVTHFQQVCDYAATAGPAVRNIHMSYLEQDKEEGEGEEDGNSSFGRDILFLHKAVEGISGGSFGLNVAKMAGMDDEFLRVAAAKAEWMRSRGRIAAAVGVGVGGSSGREAMAVDSVAPGQSAPTDGKKRPRESAAAVEEKVAGTGGGSSSGSNEDKEEKEQEKKRLKAILAETQLRLAEMEGDD